MKHFNIAVAVMAVLASFAGVTAHADYAGTTATHYVTTSIEGNLDTAPVINAPADGTFVYNGESSSYILTDDGKYVAFKNMDSSIVSGTSVKKGQVLGTSKKGFKVIYEDELTGAKKTLVVSNNMFGSTGTTAVTTASAVETAPVTPATDNGLYVKYDSAEKTTVTLEGANGTLFKNVRAGALTADSMEAVNGSQLYATNQMVAGLSKDVTRNTSSIRTLSTAVSAANEAATSAVIAINDVADLKADTSLGNLDENGRNVLSSIAAEAVQNYFAKNNSVKNVSSRRMMAKMTVSYAPSVTNSILAEMPSVNNAPAEAGAAADGSNIDVEAYTEKLDTGAISAGNTGLVSGGKVYNAIEAAKNDRLVKSEDGEIKISANGSEKTINVAGKNGARIITGVATDVNDGGSAANVAYVEDKVAESVNGINAKMDSMKREMSKEVNKAAASTAALAALHPLDYDPENKFDVSVGYGHYKDSNAAAVGAYYRPNENIILSFCMSVGDSSNAYNAGVSFKVGKGGHSVSTKAQMAAELKEVRKENKQLKSEIEELKAQVEALAKAIATK